MEGTLDAIFGFEILCRLWCWLRNKKERQETLYALVLARAMCGAIFTCKHASHVEHLKIADEFRHVIGSPPELLAHGVKSACRRQIPRRARVCAGAGANAGGGRWDI